jgi:catechol 2,3-dioxygenase-like lactoylglutathione lyase family enzyme
MRALALFLSGVGTGILIMQAVSAQSGPSLKLNHVGIAVKNFDEAVNYYTRTMGFRPAFAFKNADGTPALTYLQISKETFLEIQPASDTQPVGITHFGLEAPEINQYVSGLQRLGVSVKEAAPSVRTGAQITNAVDREGIRAELLEFGPNSTQRKAMNAWK